MKDPLTEKGKPSLSIHLTLDELGTLLLAQWHETGNEPWTVRRVTEVLKQLGWHDSGMPNAWLYVRSWLLGWAQVMRVGQDYWLPTDQLPQAIERTRLHVLPVRTSLPDETTKVDESATGESSVSEQRALSVARDESQVIVAGQATAPQATWLVRLRTVHLLEGFLYVPSEARGAYPPPVPGEKQRTVLRGLWFEDNTHLWLWLDRVKGHLYGPALAEKLAWLDAGNILRVEWRPDIIVLRLIGHDEEVHREESRLVDLEELAALRGGLGESYRRSLQAILEEASAGLTFVEVVKALRERQHHDVHRGTIRTLLYQGGFLCKNRRWFAAPDPYAGARQLRAAFVEALVPREESEADSITMTPITQVEHVRTRVKAIHARLAHIVVMLEGIDA